MKIKCDQFRVREGEKVKLAGFRERDRDVLKGAVGHTLSSTQLHCHPGQVA